ncbi:MAG: N-acetylmuramoyl-L-alanine amidase [Peptococcaceae bacterium]|jgi:N-acetylmuramoyl-L-alanine amidase|nr:N-acetylmuramoyl-L-alanine amidase [Peptococcaceae bacterium]MDH7525894.1 N-acetylmuramoyl-L-alanine amidase [Peptococcaceae bacterium]
MANIKNRAAVWLALAGTVAFAAGAFFYWAEKHDLQAIKSMSWVVAGRVLVIDPGHGGEDPGKVSPSGVYEKDINLAVAKKLYTLLAGGGGRVVLTRDSDEALSGGESTVRERKRADLENRLKLAESSGADLYLALHCNSFPQGKWYGAQTFYAPSIPGSKELASCVQEELVAYLGNTTRQPKEDTTSIIFKNASIPTVNVEMGFLSNPREEKLLQDPAYQDKVAWAIYSGIVKYLVNYGDKYVPTLQLERK